MKSPTEVVEAAIKACGTTLTVAVGAEVVAALRESGWIIVRSDAIRLAQAHARADK